MTLLTLVVILRSAATTSLSAFIPLYYIHEIGVSPLVASQMLSLLLFSGAVGTLLGGPIADRWGRLRLLATTLALMTPALLLFIAARGALAAVGLALAGGFLVSSFAVTVVMAQELLPENVGVASGVMVGFAFGLGGLLVPVVGLIADRWGLLAALQMVVLFPVGALATTGLLAITMARIGLTRPLQGPARVGTGGT